MNICPFPYITPKKINWKIYKTLVKIILNMQSNDTMLRSKKWDLVARKIVFNSIKFQAS